MAFIRFVLYPPYTHTHTYVNRQPPPPLPLTHTLPLASFSHYIMWAWTKIKRWITAEKTGRYSLSRLLWNGWISGQCEIKQKPVLSFETKTKKHRTSPAGMCVFSQCLWSCLFLFSFFLKWIFRLCTIGQIRGCFQGCDDPLDPKLSHPSITPNDFAEALWHQPASTQSRFK